MFSPFQATVITLEGSLHDQIVEQGRFEEEPVSQQRGRDLLKRFVSQVLEGEVTVSRDAEATINSRIA